MLKRTSVCVSASPSGLYLTPREWEQAESSSSRPAAICGNHIKTKQVNINICNLRPVSVVSLPLLALSEVFLPLPFSPLPPPSSSSPRPGVEPPLLSLLSPLPFGEPTPPLLIWWDTTKSKMMQPFSTTHSLSCTCSHTAQPAHLACSSCRLRSSSSLSLCSRASRRFSARIRLASSGSVVPAEGLWAGGLLTLSRRHHKSYADQCNKL